MIDEREDSYVPVRNSPRGRGSPTVNIQLSEEMERAMSAVARERGQDTDTLVTELVSEAYKMMVVPGIVFADGPAGRRARIAGTGIDVFEIVQAYLAEDRDRMQLAAAYHWLDDLQLDLALDYFRRFPDDVRPFLAGAEGRFGGEVGG
jgi:uncharacterized protein (DUF433 family)